MQTLVIGGTGAVGSEVVRALLARGTGTRVLTRTPRALPRGAEGVVGDLARPATLGAAFDGVDSVFLLTALGPNETAQGLAAVRAAVAAGARRLVYLSSFHLRISAHIEPLGSKTPIERQIGASGLDATILRAGVLFQNDEEFRDAIEHGAYPARVGSVGVSRVDRRDVADAAAEALLAAHRAPAVQTVPVVGPRAWTGSEVAALYARHLGRQVEYAGNDLDALEHEVERSMPEAQVRYLRALYELLQQHGLRASDEEVVESERAVGHRMRTFEAYVAELVASWRT